MSGRPKSITCCWRSTIGLGLIAACLAQCHCATPRPQASCEHGAIAVRTPPQLPDRRNAHDRLAASDPLGFLKMCLEHYYTRVSDYRGFFTRKERLAGGMTPEQRVEVLFRERPFSVDMRWISNPHLARRVNYVAGRWAKSGREFALIELVGMLRLLAPAGVKRDIHGALMRSHSRRPLDDFGFANTLALMIRYCEQAQGDPVYELRHVGGGLLDDRPCFVFERRLPYTGEGGAYPNRLLVIYFDREWLVPTGCFAYADDAGQELLGSYLFTDVQFNTGLSDADFSAGR